MLKHWTTHADYLGFVSSTIDNLTSNERKKLASYRESQQKLELLNLDPLFICLAPGTPIPGGRHSISRKSFAPSCSCSTSG